MMNLKFTVLGTIFTLAIVLVNIAFVVLVILGSLWALEQFGLVTALKAAL